MTNPFYEGLLTSINQEAENLFLGKKSFAEAVDAAYSTFEEIVDSTFEEIVDSPEFQAELKKYYDKFVKVDTMDEVVRLYEIVPEDSGLHYMCYDPETDTYYREHKAYTHQQALVFDTDAAAKEYINLYMYKIEGKYKSEAFGYNLSVAPFKVRTITNLGD